MQTLTQTSGIELVLPGIADMHVVTKHVALVACVVRWRAARCDVVVVRVRA
jgi:hypothetical protein